MRQYRGSLPNCRKCKSRWILWMIQVNFKKWNRITVERLSCVPSQPAAISSYCSMLGRDKRLPIDTWSTSGLQENVFGNQFSTVDSPRNLCQRIHHSMTPCDTGSVPVHIGTGTLVARDEDQNKGHNSNADICKKAVGHEFIISGGHSAEFYGWTAKTADSGTAIRQVSFAFYTMLEDKIQKPSDCLFWFSICGSKK